MAVRDLTNCANLAHTCQQGVNVSRVALDVPLKDLCASRKDQFVPRDDQETRTRAIVGLEYVTRGFGCVTQDLVCVT